MKAIYENRDVEFDKWPEVAMEGISVKMQRQGKESSGARVMRRECFCCRSGPNKCHLRGRLLCGGRLVQLYALKWRSNLCESVV